MTAPDRTRRARLAPAQRARLIEQAATELFAERGYAAASVEDIAAAAGVTKPMLYRHFESKQALCICLLQRYRDDLIAAALREFPGTDATDGANDRPAAAGDALLGRMIDGWLAWVQAHPHATRLLFTPIRGDGDVQQVQEDLFRRQRDSQSALLREFAPSLSVADAEPLAEITRSGFAAIALWWLDHPGQPRAVARQALMTMAQGIVAMTNGTNVD